MADTVLPEGVFREETVFSPAETDRSGQILPERLLYRLQCAAEHHFDSLGLGRDAAVARGSFWAVTRNDVRLDREPIPGEPLLLDTWIGRRGHGISWRHYRLLRPDGEILLRGVSHWVLMDINTRTLSRDYEWSHAAPTAALPEELPSTFREERFPDELPDTVRREVTEADCDVNGHLNNALYARWGAELLPEGFPDAHRLRKLWIEYRKELPKGHMAELHSLLSGGILWVKGFDAERQSFSLRMEYDPI